MATKTICTCDICGKEGAKKHRSFTSKEFDGHRNETFDHYYDACPDCYIILSNGANIIANALKIELTDDQFDMLKYKLLLFANAITAKAGTDWPGKPIDPPAADRIAYPGGVRDSI
jgi:hypothetical protein